VSFQLDKEMLEDEETVSNSNTGAMRIDCLGANRNIVAVAEWYPGSAKYSIAEPDESVRS
jgi:hypothetical protein